MCSPQGPALHTRCPQLRRARRFPPFCLQLHGPGWLSDPDRPGAPVALGELPCARKASGGREAFSIGRLAPLLGCYGHFPGRAGSCAWPEPPRMTPQDRPRGPPEAEPLCALQWSPLSLKGQIQDEMPIIKYPRRVDPLWHEWDRKAQKCGLRHTVYAVNGDRYVGEWLDNIKHGKGTQIWKKSGAIYSGDWKFGKRDGFGTYSIPDPVTKDYKKVYSGWWKNDKMWGYGVKFYSEGEYYEGEWAWGKRNGWGRMYYKDGAIYEGQWSEDKPGGQGMFRCKNENRYEGSWKDGKKHGPGKFIYLDTGQLYEGYWVADIPKCGTMVDFGRDEAPVPTQYPIPKIELADPDGVLEEAVLILQNAEIFNSQPQKERG